MSTRTTGAGERVGVRGSERESVMALEHCAADLGVTNALVERGSVSPRTPEHRRSPEHLVERELQASID